MGEAHARGGQLVDHRAGVALVAVAAEAVGAQRVDQDEEHVQVVALAQRVELGKPSPGPGGKIHLDQEGDGRDQQHACEQEIGPGGVEEATKQETTFW